MNLQEFCGRLPTVENLSNLQKAIAVLWWFDNEDTSTQKTAAELARVLKENDIGNPNSSSLNKQLRNSGLVYTSRGRFRLRQEKKADIRSWFEKILYGYVSEVPSDAQFLSEEVWRPTRGYIEKVCVQLNGAMHEGFFDCAAVMIRRVVETLIIEAYEKQNRESEIMRSDGNYHMLGKLVEAANSNSGLTLGREAKKGLEDIKKLGDRSAHNRRYNAKRSDLINVQDGLRLAFEELANIADLYPKK